MLNPKLIIIVAVCGFLLSFFSGLIAGVSISSLLLRALFSAIISGGVTTGISLLYRKFLEQPADSFIVGSENLSTPGSVVDITLGDDDLRDDDAGPGFYVDPSAQKKTTAASHEVLEKHAQDSEESDVSSLQNNEIQNLNVAHENPVQKNEKSTEPLSGTVQNKTIEKGSLDDELDELPDITALSRELTSSDNAEDSGGVQLNMHAEHYAEHHAEHKTQDANLMAQAIRTILTKDG